MKVFRLALISATVGAVCATTVLAEDSLKQPASIERTSFTEAKYNSYYAQDDAQGSPSDEPAAKDSGTAPTCGNTCTSCGNTCGSTCGCETCEKVNIIGAASESCCAQNLLTLGGHLDPCCKLCEPCLLMDHFPCLKDCSKVKMGGWLNQSFTWNPQNPSNRFNGPVTWTDRANEYQMNQLYYWLERTCDNKGCGWAWGARADLLFGTDYRFNTASNLETRFQFQDPVNFADHRFYGLDYLQFYGEVAYNNLKTKIGHFVSPVGYEVIQTTGNFFPTLPYIFQYGEPFTHTGVFANYQLDENSTWGNGVIRGWDNFGTNNPNLGYLGTFTHNFQDKSSYASCFIWSNEPTQNNTNFGIQNPNTQHTPRWIWTHAYTKPLTEKLNYVFQFDYAQQTNAMVNGRLARWYGWNQYLFYKVSDCWSWGTRVDLWRDEEGFRMGGFLGTDNQGSLRGLGGNFNNFAGNNFEWSVGANWRPNANTVIRPALRWDMFCGNEGWSRNQQAFNGTNAIVKPYDGGTKDWQVLLGFDWITLF